MLDLVFSVVGGGGGGYLAYLQAILGGDDNSYASILGPHKTW